MSKYKVGDKLVALESVKSVQNAIPQGQLKIMPTKVLEVVHSNDAIFSVIFDGYSGLAGSGWCFSQERHGNHFIKVPSRGDVVTELVIPAGKSLADINVSTVGCGSAYKNPAGGAVLSSNERDFSEWAPQDAFVNGLYWPVSWLRFKYQSDEEVKVKKFSDLEVGDKVVFVGNEQTRLNGYNGLSPATTAKCASQPFMTKGEDNGFWYADGSDWWSFSPKDYGTIYVDYVEPAKFQHKFSVGDKVRFKSRVKSELKANYNPQRWWCKEGCPPAEWKHLADDHIFTVKMARDTPSCGYDLHITSEATPGTWFALACDMVPVEDDVAACSGAAAEEPKKPKLTAQQKSAKRLLRLILKAQIESRRLRDITPDMQAGDVNLASLVLSIHPPRLDAIKAARHFGLDIEEVAAELKEALH